MTALFAKLSVESKRRGNGVLSHDQVRQLAREGHSLRDLTRAGMYPPITGADDGDDDGDSDADGDSDNDGDDDADDDKPAEKGKPKGAKRKPEDKPDDDADDDDDHDDDDEAARYKREASEAKARAAKAERERKRLERKLRQRETADAEDQGEFKKLYEDEKAKVEQLETKLRRGALERAVSAVATDAKAKKPSRIIRLLDLDLDTVVDDDGEVDARAIERAVKALKKSDAYLFRGEDHQAGGLNGDRPKGGRRPAADQDVRGQSRIEAAYAASN